MSFWDAYREDPKVGEDGVWVKDFQGGAEVRLRKPSSVKAREARSRIEEREPFRSALKKAARTRTRLPIELEDRLNKEWFARGIITDWKNIPDPNTGEPLPFNPENAMKIFDLAPGFYEDCLSGATNQDAFKEDNLEEDKGNC